jgi:hypothetical protein
MPAEPFGKEKKVCGTPYTTKKYLKQFPHF